MFVDEIKGKLKIDDVACAFSASLFGRSAIAVDGIKSVLLCAPNEIKLRVKDCSISIIGEELQLTEIGGGSVYVRGKLSGVSYE